MYWEIRRKTKDATQINPQTHAAGTYIPHVLNQAEEPKTITHKELNVVW